MLNKKLMIVLMSCASLMTSAQVTLDSCRHMALRNNKQMGIEQLKIEQAGYQRKQPDCACAEHYCGMVESVQRFKAER